MLPGDYILGLGHIHSTFSYDGQIPLKEIARRALDEGYSFLLISEHAETLLERNSFQRFSVTCQQLSNPNFLVIPGVEYDCSESLHIMFFATKELFFPCEPLDLISKNHQQGGLSVLAHYDLSRIHQHQEVLASVDGVEIWNKKYDGRFAFDLKKGERFNELKKINPNLKMFCGLDFHSWVDWAPLYLKVKVEAMNQDQLISALRRGDFFLSNGNIFLKAEYFEVPKEKRLPFIFQSKVSILLNRIKKEARKWVNFLRIPVPKKFREKLRRFP
jgi:hypothetical protein